MTRRAGTAFDELKHIRWLRAQTPARSDVSIGLGDDMAGLRLRAPGVLVASDMLLDGVHFDSRKHTPGLIGRKAAACNLSDCAAMAVKPVAMTVSVALPRAWTPRQARDLHRGIASAAQEFAAVVVGGDTTRWNHPLAVDVAVLAVPYRGVRPVRRSGARVGDVLCVTGPLGGSLLGKHLRFTPRVREAAALARQLRGDLHAMLDISDGLALDAQRLCRDSAVGACLEEGWLQAVISRDARSMARRDRRSALQHALTDGEDFELLLAVDAGALPHQRRVRQTVGGQAPVMIACGRQRVALYPVGRVTRRSLTLRTTSGRVVPLKAEGYVHR